jgi:hypothetical protein
MARQGAQGPSSRKVVWGSITWFDKLLAANFPAFLVLILDQVVVYLHALKSV